MRPSPSSSSSSSRSPLCVETIVSALSLIAVFVLTFVLLSPNPTTPSLKNGTPLSSPFPSSEYHHHNSLFSFNANETHNPSWMSRLPDNVSVAALSIPGTHDTLTHRLRNLGHARLQCQNWDLETQLEAGIRYIDVRARLNTSHHGGQESGEEKDADRPGTLLVYHSSAYTSYTFTDVMTTVSSFLDANPSEAIIMRLRREGPPVHVDDEGNPIRRESRRHQRQHEQEQQQNRSSSQGADPAFEKAFNYYRSTDPVTSPAFEKHFYFFPSSVTGDDEDDKSVPLLGAARGKVILLQDFDGARGTRNIYGLPWDESDRRLRIEDLWMLTDPKDMERKWVAVREALEDAAAADERESHSHDQPKPLYLTHLSASVAVDPIDVAAGTKDPEDGAWLKGINDRAGKWLEARNAARLAGKTGVMMADFPGKRLLEAIITRNDFVSRHQGGRH